MPKNGFRLFQVFGITVFLHWSWFLVAAYDLMQRRGNYTSPLWNVAELIALFAIVTMHEFGHALACRSVGGRADRIVLWPLGGVAYVSPPLRPGAMLWSIVAGPLVNVALLPLTLPFLFLSGTSDFDFFLRAVAIINLVLLIFNMLPVYPLDGGKILWSLLWFALGMGRSLMVASIIGIIGAVGLGIFALYVSGPWLGLMAAFAAYQAWMGFRSAQMVLRRQSAPVRETVACPVCRAHPPLGPFWICSQCKARFDAFEHQISCPGCGRPHLWNTCLACRAKTPFAAWTPQPPVAPSTTTA
jgi:Zn-dependent protease